MVVVLVAAAGLLDQLRRQEFLERARQDSNL
jgi:hypothetical protein